MQGASVLRLVRGEGAGTCACCPEGCPCCPEGCPCCPEGCPRAVAGGAASVDCFLSHLGDAVVGAPAAGSSLLLVVGVELLDLEPEVCWGGIAAWLLGGGGGGGGGGAEENFFSASLGTSPVLLNGL